MFSGKCFKHLSTSLSIMQHSNHTIPLLMKTKSVNISAALDITRRKWLVTHKLCHKQNVCEGGKTLITHTDRERVHR